MFAECTRVFSLAIQIQCIIQSPFRVTCCMGCICWWFVLRVWPYSFSTSQTDRPWIFYCLHFIQLPLLVVSCLLRAGNAMSCYCWMSWCSSSLLLAFHAAVALPILMCVLLSYATSWMLKVILMLQNTVCTHFFLHPPSTSAHVVCWLQEEYIMGHHMRHGT